MTESRPAATVSAPDVSLRTPISPRPRWIQIVGSSDHKQIGAAFVVMALAFFALIATAGLMTWLHRISPSSTLLSGETFNRLSTIHDTSLMFFFALPLMIGLMTYIVPLMIGARATAFPRLSLLSFWLVLLGGITLFVSLFVDAPDAGFSGSQPLANFWFSSTSGMDFWGIAIALAALGFVLNAIDLVVTLHGRRETKVSVRKMPIFARTSSVYAWTMLVIGPVLFAATMMMLIERTFESVVFFDPARGGSALLWQHLFWFFAHPAQILVALVGAAIAAEIVQTFTRSTRLDANVFHGATALLAGLAVLSYGQHLFDAPIDGAWSLFFMICGLLAVIPAIVIAANLVAGITGGARRIRAPFLFAVGYTIFFGIAIIGMAMFAVPPVAQQLLGSQFEAAYIGLVLAGLGVLGGLAGVHYWLPKINGRTMSDGLGKVSYGLIAVGFLIFFLSMASLGIQGMPAYAYRYRDDLQVENIEALIGLVIAGTGVFLTYAAALRGHSKGPAAGNDPWQGRTLEWFAPSPPPRNNFDVVPQLSSDQPMLDLREQIAGGSNRLEGSVAQPTTAGRQSLKGKQH